MTGREHKSRRSSTAVYGLGFAHLTLRHVDAFCSECIVPKDLSHALCQHVHIWPIWDLYNAHIGLIQCLWIEVAEQLVSIVEKPNN